MTTIIKKEDINNEKNENNPKILPPTHILTLDDETKVFSNMEKTTKKCELLKEAVRDLVHIYINSEDNLDRNTFEAFEEEVKWIKRNIRGVLRIEDLTGFRE